MGLGWDTGVQTESLGAARLVLVGATATATAIATATATATATVSR